MTLLPRLKACSDFCIKDGRRTVNATDMLGADGGAKVA